MLQDFLAPVLQSIIDKNENNQLQSLAKNILIHDEIDGIPDLEGVQLAIIGVEEDRGSLRNKGCSTAPNAVREYLYQLTKAKWNLALADLGNIYAGERLEDTYAALHECCASLMQQNIIPIIIGGGQDLTYSTYRAFDKLEQTVNITSIDSRINLGDQTAPLTSENYLSHIILQKPYRLFNYSQIGHQTYFINQDELDLMDRMYFDSQRLGAFRNNIQEAEPYLRDADLVSFDIASVRQSDAPGNLDHSPNGFSGEEACAISRYAGISDKVSSFGIYEYNPKLDKEGRTAHLIAQMIWYFIEGFYSRQSDYPIASKIDYDKFTVLINEGEHELVFFKSPRSGRWWIEVPLPKLGGTQHDRHSLIPCSYEDYKNAMQNDLPIRWWKAIKKTV